MKIKLYNIMFGVVTGAVWLTLLFGVVVGDVVIDDNMASLIPVFV